jgi:two-component system CheB/CheR fusion protein
MSRVNLLVSRNTLMYFDPSTQSRILQGFHFALAPEGFMLLGKSEVLLTRSSLFVPVDLRRRIFVKTIDGGARSLPLPEAPPAAEEPEPAAAGDARDRESGFDTSPLAQIALDDRDVLVAVNREARRLFGIRNTDVGRPFADLELSYRPAELRPHLAQVQADREPVSLYELEWAPDGEKRFLDVLIAPLTTEDGSFLGSSVTFADVTRYRRVYDALELSRHNVESAYRELQSTVEELETTNEELQSMNEELETTNEELQSTNEELETMNEEMQSTNEELETMNDELRLRTDELHRSNAFFDAVLTSLRTACVVVDTELAVEVWNREAEDMWGLRREEVLGAHLLDLDIGLPVEQLSKPIRVCLAGETVPNLTLQATNRRGRRLAVSVTLLPLVVPARRQEPIGAILLMDEDGARPPREP